MTRGELKDFLDQMVLRYNQPDFIQDDPIKVPHQFTEKEDIEIAGFLAATIAWGQRKTILTNAQKLVTWMDMKPAQFIREHQTSDRKAFSQFVHRTFNGEDAAWFLEALQLLYRNHGGLEGAFAAGLKEHGNIPGAISYFHQLFFSFPNAPQRTRKHVADPHRGSSAKRINMYLRWMVRSDQAGVDFGIWDQLSPADLFLPLDVHTGNVARKLKLLKRKQNDWKSVQEVTENLRKLDPDDPVKYDFALFGLGVYEGF